MVGAQKEISESDYSKMLHIHTVKEHNHNSKQIVLLVYHALF